MRKCDYCFQMGHKKSDCPKLTEDLETNREETKKKKRQVSAFIRPIDSSEVQRSPYKPFLLFFQGTCSC